MFLAILTLISGLGISAVAAYYSIIGLSTLFSGAVTAIIIMGIALEVGKLVTATLVKASISVDQVSYPYKASLI